MMRQQGADLTELRPPHINPSEEILAKLGIDSLVWEHKAPGEWQFISR
jgi:hypothetical protein